MPDSVALSSYLDDLHRQGHLLTQNFLHSDVPAPSFADDSVVRILLDGFRSEGRSTCVFILVGCIADVILAHKRDGNSAALDMLRTHALIFLTASRTRAELAALVTRLQCSCSDLVTQSALLNRLHGQGIVNYEGRCVESGQRTPANALLKVVAEAFSQFCVARNYSRDSWPCQMQRHHRRVAQAAGLEPGAVPSWPHSVRDLLPHGAKTALGLVAWLDSDLDADTGSTVFMLIDSLAHACPAEIVPSLIGNATLVRVMIGFIRRAEKEWPLSQLEEKQTWMQLLLCISGLLATLLDRATPGEQDLLWRCSPASLLAASSRALRILKLDGPSLWVNFSASAVNARRGVSVHSQATLSRAICCIRIACPETSQVPLDPDALGAMTGRIMDTLSKREQPWIQLLTRLDLLHLRHRCGNPDCPAPIPFHGARWPYCAQCKRVPFCSSRCQRSAWRHPSCPHALACVHLRAVCSQLRIPRRVGPGDLKKRPPIMSLVRQPPGNEWTHVIVIIVQYFDAMFEYLASIGGKTLLSLCDVLNADVNLPKRTTLD
jgi:hypothetical protein